jgi:hypothetical protein
MRSPAKLWAALRRKWWRDLKYSCELTEALSAPLVCRNLGLISHSGFRMSTNTSDGSARSAILSKADKRRVDFDYDHVLTTPTFGSGDGFI